MRHAKTFLHRAFVAVGLTLTLALTACGGKNPRMMDPTQPPPDADPIHKVLPEKIICDRKTHMIPALDEQNEIMRDGGENYYDGAYYCPSQKALRKQGPLFFFYLKPVKGVSDEPPQVIAMGSDYERVRAQGLILRQLDRYQETYKDEVIEQALTDVRLKALTDRLEREKAKRDAEDKAKKAKKKHKKNKKKNNSTPPKAVAQPAKVEKPAPVITDKDPAAKVEAPKDGKPVKDTAPKKPKKPKKPKLSKPEKDQEKDPVKPAAKKPAQKPAQKPAAKPAPQPESVAPAPELTPPPAVEQTAPPAPASGLLAPISDASDMKAAGKGLVKRHADVKPVKPVKPKKDASVAAYDGPSPMWLFGAGFGTR